MHQNLPSLELRPRDFLERLRFFLRRPDYGWKGIFQGNALIVRPANNRVQRMAGSPALWRIEERVGGMKTLLWFEEKSFQPGSFAVENIPAQSAWAREWKEVFGDYVRYLWPNSPSVLLGLVMILAMGGFLYYLNHSPNEAMHLLMESDAQKVIWVLAQLCLIPVLGSLWVCRHRPSRTRIANLLFQVEALLLLLSIFLSLPDLARTIQTGRQQLSSLGQMQDE